MKVYEYNQRFYVVGEGNCIEKIGIDGWKQNRETLRIAHFLKWVLPDPDQCSFLIPSITDVVGLGKEINTSVELYDRFEAIHG